MVPRSPFVARIAQPLYRHVQNTARAELEGLVTALRLVVDLGPYGASDVGRDLPNDDAAPVPSSFSSHHDYPDNPHDACRATDEKKKKKTKKKKKKKKMKEQGKGGHRPRESKAIAMSEIVVNPFECTTKDLSEFAESFGKILRMTRQTHATGRLK